ncbi:MAG: hypothetical protein OER95_02070 [Acidimicrobiia bacterium]|nr:hypothetical protein [Acidimicrobiia bacterium]
MVVESFIADMRSSVDGELTGRSQVVDHLLDLRLAASANSAVVEIIDRLLADLPGRTTVPNEWWLGVLADVERAWRHVPVAAGGSGTPPPVADRARTVPPPLPRRIRPE